MVSGDKIHSNMSSATWRLYFLRLNVIIISIGFRSFMTALLQITISTGENHYTDVLMSAMASQIISLTIVCSSRHRSKKTPKLRVTGLCAGNSPATGEFPAQKPSNAENVSIWWRHHVSTQIRDTEMLYQTVSVSGRARCTKYGLSREI